MKLSETQEAHVRRYLQDVDHALDGRLPEARRREAVDRLRDRIHATLDQLPAEATDEEAVKNVLRNLGTPSAQAAQLIAHHRAPDARFVPDTQRAFWLGVCAGLARRVAVAPWMVRVATVGLTVVTFGLALWAYVGVWVVMVLGLQPQERPPIDYARLIRIVAITVIVATALHWGTGLLLQALEWGYTTGLQQERLPQLGEAGFIRYSLGSYYFWVLAWGLPLSVLAGLPLANGWHFSLNRLVQAGLAVYGIYLAYGVARMLVALLLHFTENFDELGTVLPLS